MTPDRCRSCRARIHWARTAAGKAMPIEERSGGNLVVETDLLGDAVVQVVEAGSGTHDSHFATCPDARKWRR